MADTTNISWAAHLLDGNAKRNCREIPAKGTNRMTMNPKKLSLRLMAKSSKLAMHISNCT
jgi:hypothetical protein